MTFKKVHFKRVHVAADDDKTYHLAWENQNGIFPNVGDDFYFELIGKQCKVVFVGDYDKSKNK